jgi:hypothetical protein
MTLDVFSPLPPATQRANHAAYRQFLQERDGAADIDKRTLSLRELGMARYARPLSKLREVDHALFYEGYAKFNPRRPMSQEALLLMALVKTNGAEAYGVSQTYDMVYRRAAAAHDDVELLLLIEETYHTRILLSAAGLYGLQIDAPFQPPIGLRTLVGCVGLAPEIVSRPLVLAGEILGTLTFLNLLDAVRIILKHDPELRDAIEERVIEILIDEVGHISFNRMLLGPAGLARARWLLPLVVKGLSTMVPEMSAIGLRTTIAGADTLTTSARLPESVRRAAFVA